MRVGKKGDIINFFIVVINNTVMPMYKRDSSTIGHYLFRVLIKYGQLAEKPDSLRSEPSTLGGKG